MSWKKITYIKFSNKRHFTLSGQITHHIEDPEASQAAIDKLNEVRASRGLEPIEGEILQGLCGVQSHPTGSQYPPLVFNSEISSVPDGALCKNCRSKAGEE